MKRRDVLLQAGHLAALGSLASIGFLPSAANAQAVNAAAFQAKTLSEALRLLGAGSAATSAELLLIAPEIAENGALVDIRVRSTNPKTTGLVLLAEKNPQPLVAAFDIVEGTDPDVVVQIKLSQSSPVIALARFDGRFLMVRKDVQVTLGGCGN
jgi:sulfur-oxidizing protein SoxY